MTQLQNNDNSMQKLINIEIPLKFECDYYIIIITIAGMDKEKYTGLAKKFSNFIEQINLSN